jgi:hypothetical protein
MPWFKVDDTFWRSGKVRRLGLERTQAATITAAIGLWTLAGTWAAENLTDGFVPLEVIKFWDKKFQLSEKIISVGLWKEETKEGEKGIQFHDWNDYQPPAEKIIADRKAAAQRMSRVRESRKTNINSSPERSPTVRPNVQPKFAGSSPNPVPVPVTKELSNETSLVRARPRTPPKLSTTDQRIRDTQALKALFAEPTNSQETP